MDRQIDIGLLGSNHKNLVVKDGVTMAMVSIPDMGTQFSSLTDVFEWLRSLPDDSVAMIKNLAANEIFLRRHGAGREVQHG